MRRCQGAGDQIWVSRYLAERNAEKYGLSIEWHPKPLGATDWNGSGMHVNFSDGKMRDEGGEQLMSQICEAFGKNIKAHIDVYGAHNEQRLTGLHETQSIHEFSYGVSDRGASIRIPIGTIEDGWKGRLRIEGRHPTVTPTRLGLQSSRRRSLRTPDTNRAAHWNKRLKTFRKEEEKTSSCSWMRRSTSLRLNHCNSVTSQRSNTNGHSQSPDMSK